MDEDLAVCGEQTDAEIVADVMNIRNYGTSSDEEEDQLELPEIPIPTASQASNYIQDLRRFVEGQQNLSLIHI